MNYTIYFIYSSSIDISFFSGWFYFFIAVFIGVIDLKSFISIGEIVDLKHDDYIDDVPSIEHFNTL